MTDQESDVEYKRLCDELKPLLTDEFLATLVEAAQIDGNMGDWPATKDFVVTCFYIAGKQPPELKPYQ